MESIPQRIARVLYKRTWARGTPPLTLPPRVPNRRKWKLVTGENDPHATRTQAGIDDDDDDGTANLDTSTSSPVTAPVAIRLADCADGRPRTRRRNTAAMSGRPIPSSSPGTLSLPAPNNALEHDTRDKIALALFVRRRRHSGES